MPSCPVHLKAAYILSGKLGIDNKADFFLGSIAPDCVNVKGFASQSIRYSAHVRVKDAEIWKRNLADFFYNNKCNFSDCTDFLKGYIFHCFTDICWDEIIQPKLFEYFNSLGISDDEKPKVKWDELYRLNGVLVKEDWYSRAITYVSKGKAHDIASVTSEQINEYRNYVVNGYCGKIYNEPPKFLCSRHVEELCQYILNNIK